MLTRRELLAAGAGTGICMGLPRSAAAVLQDTNTVISKPIPSTGETLPVIGLGANRWVANDNDMLVRLDETLSTFTSQGGRVIDTAPSYRSSETALGNLIAEQDLQDAFFLATKVDRTEAAEGLARMQASLEKLRTDSVDLMQIHNMRGAESQLENLLQWQADGRIRYIGLTTSHVDQYAEMEELMNRYPVDFIQLNYSLIGRQAENRLLPMAADKQIAVIANLPFQRGRLFKAVADTPLPDLAGEIDCSSWAQFFLKFVVSHPAVTCAIPGMTRPEHAADNMGAAYGRLPDASQRQRMAALFKAG
jgi:aryl-alcohol dehydrogenase-like predicted oxidoreductase